MLKISTLRQIKTFFSFKNGIDEAVKLLLINVQSVHV